MHKKGAITIADDLKNFSHHYLGKTINKRLNLFWIGFVIYSVAFTISRSTFVNNNVCLAIQLFGLFLFIPPAINLIQFKFDNIYLKTTYFLYLIWLFFIIIRGFLFNYLFIKTMLFDAYEGVFIYFVPLILLFPRNLAFYKKIFTVIAILGIFYIIYDIIFFKALLNPDSDDITGQEIVEYFSKTLSISCGFLLLTYLYHSNKRKALAFFVIILTLLLAAIKARRSLIFMCLSILICTCIIYFYINKSKSSNIILFLIFLMFISLFGFKVFNNNKNGLFSLITTRANDDTRTGVELFFYADMKTADWIIGRGINGQYYCPSVSPTDDYRSGIETDYLNIILKGGIISLALLFLIVVPAIFKGIFYSKNILSKAAGIWILLWLIDLYPTPVTKFTLHYLLVWISIGICYSKKIRNLSEANIIEYFQSANYIR